METSDIHLVKLAVLGEGPAFAALLARHYDLIFRLSFRMLGTRADAEDLAQDICVALPGKLAGFQANSRFTTWLYRVTTNAAIDRLRVRKTRRKAVEGWGELEMLKRAEHSDKQSEIKWLYQSMANLSPELRETVALVLGEGQSHAAAARALDVSEGTISWRMSEVRKILRARAAQEEQTR